MTEHDGQVASPNEEALVLASSTLMESLDLLRAVELIAEGQVAQIVAGVELKPEQQLALISATVRSYLAEAESARQLLILLTQ